MLRLDDRLRIAIGNGMGVQLAADEVKHIARWLVVLRQIAEQPTRDKGDAKLMRDLALHALEQCGMEPVR